MNTFDAGFRKTRYEARYLSCRGNKLKKVWSKSNYIFKNQKILAKIISIAT